MTAPALKCTITTRTIHLTSLCSAYWIDADLYAMRQTAESALIPAKHDQLPDTVPYVLYFQGIFHYQRNELKTAEEKLDEVVESYGAKSPMNYAHSAFALALCHQAQGKTAVAFEVELALHQGRIDNALQLARRLDTLTLQPAHKFYFSQCTLIKVLLAEGTMDSRQAGS